MKKWKNKVTSLSNLSPKENNVLMPVVYIDGDAHDLQARHEGQWELDCWWVGVASEEKRMWWGAAEDDVTWCLVGLDWGSVISQGFRHRLVEGF